MLFAPLALFLALSRVAAAIPGLGVFRLLGETSGSIYAFHTPFILQPLLIILFKLKVPQALNVTLSVLITLAACVVIHKILHRYAWLKWFRI